jgi:transposase
MPRYLGVDLHKNNFTVCYLCESGEETMRKFILSQLEQFKKTLQPAGRIAVEAIGNSRYFRNEVSAYAAKVTVVDPGQFKVISSSYKKPIRKTPAFSALFEQRASPGSENYG